MSNSYTVTQSERFMDSLTQLVAGGSDHADERACDASHAQDWTRSWHDGETPKELLEATYKSPLENQKPKR